MICLEMFTKRENEVLALIAQGKTNSEIADSLVIAEATVEHHVHNIFRKRGFKNRTEAAIYALRNGTDPDQR